MIPFVSLVALALLLCDSATTNEYRLLSEYTPDVLPPPRCVPFRCAHFSHWFRCVCRLSLVFVLLVSLENDEFTTDGSSVRELFPFPPRTSNNKGFHTTLLSFRLRNHSFFAGIQDAKSTSVCSRFRCNVRANSSLFSS